ncbi:uncharacterized protein [Apostichopus japonicus]|uniref:uncharacterized protein n=1 Tax=Stichopus japonicus TaxID=307972 RepID=UPI003AB613A2
MEKEGWRFRLTVEGKNEHEPMNVEFLTVPKIPASEEGIPTMEELSKWEHLRLIPWEDHWAKEVGILIGADSPQAFWVLEEKKGKPKDPYAIRTPLGWSVMGPGGKGCKNGYFNRIQVSNQQLLDEVQKSWAIENSGLYERQDSVQDSRARKVMESTMKKTEDGHYEMGLLWKNDNHDMPLNKAMAESRLESLKRRLSSNKDLHAKYTDVMEGYIKQGYAEPVVNKGIPGNVWYLPHHPVENPHKNKVRVVYDCAARFAGTSLNDQLLKGPDLMNDLLGVLLRFRQGRVAIVSDIEAMFHQVKMIEPDRDVLRFLWWANGDMKTSPREYRMCVHLFGATSSPCCAGKALKQTADDNELTNRDKVGKQALEIMRDGFYVDDCLGSVQSVEEAIKVLQRLSTILKEGGFRLTKWLSNERAVLASVDEHERAPSVRLSVDRLPTERTLGVCWNAESDSFTFQLTLKMSPTTRRGLLSVTSSVFDPLGMASPFVMIARSLLQEVCRRGAEWDQPLTDEEQGKWSKWLHYTKILSQVSVPRWFKFDAITEAQLHIFCDASEKGYAAVAYFRVEQPAGGHNVEFVLGKSRVSPLKHITIPRLELMAAVLAATLDSTIRREIRHSFGDTTFWSDSMIVLSYIRNENRRYKTFVANRVAKILSVSSCQQWRHVPTNVNPADGGSRGAHELETWLKGPDFLPKEEAFWPASKFDADDDEQLAHDLEIKRSVIVQQVGVKQRNTGYDSLISTMKGKFSSWKKLTRVLGWVLRFVKSLKSKVKHQPTVNGNLLVSEITESETMILSCEQKQSFPEWQSDKRLNSLRPVLLGQLLRVGGRLDNACIDYDAKHPIILAGNGEITRMLIWHYHLKVGHSGWSTTLNALRERFWILAGRSAVKAMLRNCVTCKRHNARREEQLMASLPEERVTADKPPFTYAGLDYFGPIDVKQGRSSIKMYGCIFTCLASRAVHIEVANSLNTDSFINAYQRFVGRRGDPAKIYSDNGSNFVAAQKELKKALYEMNQDRVEEVLHTQGVEWHFNPPSASHFGGVWERLIRSVRKVLHGILKQQSVDKDVLQTVLTEVENILNSRPITDLSPEAHDEEPLTPNHLLLMRKGATAPIGKTGVYSKRRWHQAQYLSSLFWTRWKKEYLPLLQKRHKWTIPRKNVQVGDIVLLVDEVLPRGRWSMGKVITVYRSKDGKVRSVDLKVAGGTLKRPITKLCVIYREVIDGGAKI